MTADARHDTPISAVPPRRAVPDRARAPRTKRFHLPIAAVLTLGFGGLTLVAVASVLLLGLITTSRNTMELLHDKAELLMDGLEARVRAQLDPARAQVEYLADLMSRGEIDPMDEGQLARHLRSALAAGPQITGLGFLSNDRDFILATRRGPRDVRMNVERNVFWGEETLALGRALGGAVWIDPIWADDLSTSVFTVQIPVRRDGRFLGMLLTGVSFTDLSRFLADIREESGLNAFILFDDRYVLAHPILRDRTFDFSDIDEMERPPLPMLEELGDPVAGAIWQRADPQGIATGAGPEPAGRPVDVRLEMEGMPSDVSFRASEVDGQEYVYLLKQLTDYGEHPWTLAISFTEEEVTLEFDRVARLAGVGFGILIVSVLMALWLGRKISRQIKRLSGAAVALRELDFGAVPTLPDSRFREISDAARAFNTMVMGLRWFETYVPKALVLRLIQRDGRAGDVISEEREVTVMFTDVKGFSAMAEQLSPQETADWLNVHFTRLAACIEAEGGTVDKFIGDSVMAFWGAPEDQPDHAARALRAARAVAAIVAEEAAEAEAAGRPPVCLRMGVHSGPVVVGNIGAASRINYTIVGDTVNTAARLEALGDELLGQDCFVALASAETVRAAGACGVTARSLGEFNLRGRAGAVEVCKLEITQFISA